MQFGSNGKFMAMSLTRVSHAYDMLRRHRYVVLFLVVVGVYLSNRRGLFSSDNIPARLLPVSIICEGNLDLNEFVASPTPEVPYYVTKVGGRYLSSFPIGAPLTVLPVYLLFWLVGFQFQSMNLIFLEKLSAALIAAGSVLVLYSVLEHLTSKGKSLVLAAIYAFGSSTWTTSSQALWQHGASQLYVCFMFLGLVLARKRPGFLALAGFSLGMAILSRPSSAVLWPLVVVLLVGEHLRQRQEHSLAQPGRAMLLFHLPLLLPLGFMVFYHLSYYHTLLGGYLQLIGKHKFLEQPHRLENLAGLLISPSRGLFIYSPVFLTSLYGSYIAVREVKRHWFYFVVALMTVAYVGVLTSYTKWWGGWNFGPRYMTDLLPLLVLLCVRPLELLSGKVWFRVVFAVLVLWSVTVQAIGAFYEDNGWNRLSGVDYNESARWDWKNNQILFCLTQGRSFYGNLREASYYSLEDHTIDFSKPGSERYVYYGFYPRETAVVWLKPSGGELLFSLPAEKAWGMTIETTALNQPWYHQRLTVSLNGTRLGTFTYEQGYPELETFTLQIPPGALIGGVEHLHLDVRYGMYHPSGQGMPLGAAIRRMTFIPHRE